MVSASGARERFDTGPVADQARLVARPASLVAAAILHLGLIALVVLGLPPAAPLPAEVIAVDIVQLGDEPTTASAEHSAPLPQQRAPVAGQTTEAVPSPETPPPVPARQTAETITTGMPTVEQASPARELLPLPPLRPRRAASPEPKASAPAEPRDDLAARLQRFARRSQPSPPLPPMAADQKGEGLSNQTAEVVDAARSARATFRVTDYIRAQVLRRWNPPAARSVDGSGWVVAVRIAVNPDGRVRTAEIVDDPVHARDPAYREFARSARNAVLLSSPLTLPPGAFDLAGDIVVPFDTRQVTR